MWVRVLLLYLCSLADYANRFITPQGYVTYIAVRPGWSGAGIGAFMLYHLIQVANLRWQRIHKMMNIQACGKKDITMHVNATNDALLLYQKFGFKVD